MIIFIFKYILAQQLRYKIYSVKPGSSLAKFWEEAENVEKRLELEREKDENQRKMNAGNVEKLTNSLDNFVGIFDLKKLKNLKIVSYPCSLILLIDEHWISFYLTNETIEIMDSMGYFSSKNIPNVLQIFLSSHLLGKKLISTPQLQSDDSNLCALYSICFLYYRSLSCGSLCDFCKLFSTNLTENCAIISKMFENIKTINNF